ncbi:MAG: Na+-transporting NADH:ubiquinone oxidoreductase subunit [Candidatus Hydrogenedentes bacterium]|nr:Na+-transporting NADH:ubiquinone oxidoreductase subunit [Candidatus Hydrogenedentota bacterium]
MTSPRSIYVGVTERAPHVRDALDVRRLTLTVMVALAPCALWALYDRGAPSFLTAFIVTFAVGGAWEVLYAVLRRRAVNEGFLVTSLLFALILPPDVPLTRVALGISFGVLVGKVLVNRGGMNMLHPALAARALLYAADPIPGSLGDMPAWLCLMGAAILIVTQAGSWRVMAGVAAGTVAMSLVFNAAGPDANAISAVPFWRHMVLGGWAFGTVFLCTDPVTGCYTDIGRCIYGFSIGVLVVLVRVTHPAHPDGVMLSILLMNVFAAQIDSIVLQRNVKRRIARSAVRYTP